LEGYRNVSVIAINLFQEVEDRKVDEVKEAKNKAPTGSNEMTKKDVKTAPYWFEDGNPSFHLKNAAN